MLLYQDGKGIPEISGLLGVSETSLYKWKGESLVPGEKIDLWDRRRIQKRSNLQRMRDLLDAQYEYIESLRPEERDSRVWDGLSKAFSIVERTDKMEEAIRKKTIEEAAKIVGEVARTYKKKGLSDAAAEEIRKKILGIGAA
jgi:RNA polymerase-interacting CarD/CdnL/TRCF family regulator